ncbi:hypothetical protein [Massilia sp. NR 4-1]|uniref:hypothetical protein n=1 Tax=Massilia sp. NR 4-1 TaxID=1678028 RepID=UPI0012377A0D|nr:hypothetical protein [Massilia sp. NR 4-1]
MNSQILKTPADYAAALKEIDALMSAERGTSDGLRLQILANLIQEYELIHFPMDPPNSMDGK